MIESAHSEYGKIKSVFIKTARAAFVSSGHIAQHWEELNFLSQPDFNLAQKEYENFQSLLKAGDTEISFFPEAESVNMDSIYCRDAAIATNGGVIICRMGKEGRKNEPEAQRKAFESQGVNILGAIEWPGTVEGGDVAWIDEHTLAVGHTYRTNPEGIRQLTQWLKPLEVNVRVVSLPHYKGPSDVFHLMSIFSPVDKDLAVIYSPLMPISFREELLERGFRFVEVPDAEFESMGCNVLAVAPGKCVMVDGNPQTRSALEKAGCSVTVYAGNEISVKGGGGPTCLTRPIWRWI
jgi:N-dimethylarginine dimethylaminohydrolase